MHIEMTRGTTLITAVPAGTRIIGDNVYQDARQLVWGSVEEFLDFANKYGYAVTYYGSSRNT